MINDQWIRKIGLLVLSGGQALDLSAFHIRFDVAAADVETPNNATIRVYNLSDATVLKIRGEFSQVVLNAGYENGNYGVIFQGSIKQFRIGRESNTTKYLDILASDGDIGYNSGTVNTTLAKGTTQKDQVEVCTKAMVGDVQADFSKLFIDKQHVPNLRGTVLWGMANARMRNCASTLDASWSIQNGVVTIINKTGYDPNQTVELNAMTGLIGLPEQTDGGLMIRCLLNSRLRVGGSVRINNSFVNQILQQNPDAAPVAYNSRTALQPIAPLSPDGVYRIFVIEHEGDTRGQPWYSNLICLAVDISSPADAAVSKQ